MYASPARTGPGFASTPGWAKGTPSPGTSARRNWRAHPVQRFTSPQSNRTPGILRKRKRDELLGGGSPVRTPMASETSPQNGQMFSPSQFISVAGEGAVTPTRARSGLVAFGAAKNLDYNAPCTPTLGSKLAAINTRVAMSASKQRAAGSAAAHEDVDAMLADTSADAVSGAVDMMASPENKKLFEKARDVLSSNSPSAAEKQAKDGSA